MNQRIIGFDLARAYAIFGMFIVNFNFCFGALVSPTDAVGRFLNCFTGNSTAIFIICAGMGVSFLSNQVTDNVTDKSKLKSKVLKRSWFLFALGLSLFNWWSGDILHFYGGYMHLAAFLLFMPKRYYLVLAILFIIVYHLLTLIIPLDTSWNFGTFQYLDFWTPLGFLRNTFYNGWNSIFPWFAYFLVGMYLGKLDWQNKQIRKTIFLTGLSVFIPIQLLIFLAKQNTFTDYWNRYITADYFPPFIPFMLVTMAFALMVIPLCMYIGDKFSGNKLINVLQKTGQMTLTHYVIHLTLGMLLLEQLTHKHYTGFLEDEQPTSSSYILIYSLTFFSVSCMFSYFWSKKFSTGPLELVMRKISN